MADSVFRRRAGAAAGIYSSIVLGFLATVVAAPTFSTEVLGFYTLVISSACFFQTLLDLTIEEALIKYGFRYVEREDWGRLRRLFRRTFVFKAVGAALPASRSSGSPSSRAPSSITLRSGLRSRLPHCCRSRRRRREWPACR